MTKPAVSSGFREDDGWQLVAQCGSHQQYEHPSKPGKVTEPTAIGTTLVEVPAA